MSNNHKNSSCQFAEQIVSYLYDEFVPAEKIKFEAHLNDCRNCAAELAGFGLVRSAVLEWRDTEFTKLAVPTFAISDIETANSLPAVPSESGSWFDQVRKMFSFNPALAATALAVAIVAVGIAFFAFNFSDKNELAGTSKEEDLVKATVSPTIEITKKAEENAADKQNKKSSPPTVEINDAPKEVKRLNPTEPEKTVVKVSATVPKNNATNTTVTLKENNDKKTSPVKKQRVPNLNEAEDDEDKTIRLADLFDELDTK